MTGGEVLVDGDVGTQAGRLLAGGRLILHGNAGPWAASGMKGGVIEIRGAADDHLGGPLAGEMAGMRGGLVVVRGRAGDRAGDRMRRGTIIIEGGAGAYAGSRMIAGTLIVGRKAGALPGFLMKRGTIVLGEGSSALSPTFLDCGQHRASRHAIVGGAYRALQQACRVVAPAAAAALRRGHGGPWQRGDIYRQLKLSVYGYGWNGNCIGILHKIIA